ncbi:MAG: hypothetical protein RR191_05470 [Cetobacterium sp.]
MIVAIICLIIGIGILNFFFIIVLHEIPSLLLKWLRKIEPRINNKEKCSWILFFVSILVFFTNIYLKVEKIPDLLSILAFISTLYFFNETEKNIAFKSCVKIITFTFILNVFFENNFIGPENIKTLDPKDAFNLLLLLAQYLKAIFTSLVYIEGIRLTILIYTNVYDGE